MKHYDCNIQAITFLAVTDDPLPRPIQIKLDNRHLAYFGQPFVERFALLDHRPVCPVLSVLSMLWPNGWMDQDATW